MNIKEALERRIAISRGNLLLMTILTVVNIATYWFELGFMLPFSAFVPLTIFDFGYYFSIELADPSLFTLGIVLAALIIIFYLIGYILSKKNPRWLMITMWMYIFDTLIMIYLFATVFVLNGTMILDIVFHIWVLYYFINGVLAVKKLNLLPETFDESEVI